MSFFRLRPAFQKERFLQIKQQAVQGSLARFSQVFREACGFEFNQILFNFLVQLFFLSRVAAADDFRQVAQVNVRVDFR